MPREGYKETLSFDDQEWTPIEIRNAIQSELRSTRISREKYFRVLELADNMRLWLDSHVRKNAESGQ